MVVFAGNDSVFMSASTSESINAPAAVTLAVSVTSAQSSTFKIALACVAVNTSTSPVVAVVLPKKLSVSICCILAKVTASSASSVVSTTPALILAVTVLLVLTKSISPVLTKSGSVTDTPSIETESPQVQPLGRSLQSIFLSPTHASNNSNLSHVAGVADLSATSVMTAQSTSLPMSRLEIVLLSPSIVLLVSVSVLLGVM